MNMGIKGSNNEPHGTNKMALLDAHSHDKDNGDVTGTFEVTAAFVYARSQRLGPHFAQNQQAVQSRCKVTPRDNLLRKNRRRASSRAATALVFSSLANDDLVR
jgi:hypothetical protein